MAHYIAGQEIRVFTADDDGNLGPFVDRLTGDPVTPDAVVAKFRLEPAGGPLGPTIEITQGSSTYFDVYNPAITITQDLTTLGFFYDLITTQFVSMYSATSVILRTTWESQQNDPTVSFAKLDTIYPADL
jgi:hypothetical protein